MLSAFLEFINVATFDQAAATHYGQLRPAVLKNKADALDKLIAGHAKSLGLIVVTNNEKGFRRYPGINIENWVNPP